MTFDKSKFNDDDYWEQCLRLTIYWIVKRYGEDMNMLLLDAANDVPTDIDINWERLGNDVIVTVLSEEKNASK